MQQADFQRFKSVMTGMAKVYERELDGILLDAYWVSLRSWSLQEFEAAAAHLMETATYMPRPAQFAELRRASRPCAGEAWIRVLEHVRSGAYREGPLADDLVDAAARAVGGYRFLAMSNENQLHYMERRFAEHFATIEDRVQIRRDLPRLAPPAHRLELEADEEEDEEAFQTDTELTGEEESDD